MSKDEINYKDLTSKQLGTLKELYVDNRVKSMSEIDLRKFVREALELQVRGTVGNEEEREVWKEMKEYFAGDFDDQITQIVKENWAEEVAVPPEQLEFQKRLELLEQRKSEKSDESEDMW
tara:strand:- start:80 stop:439 length:360 start_codon:yes stop_codon:yes gene_type:complete